MSPIHASPSPAAAPHAAQRPPRRPTPSSPPSTPGRTPACCASSTAPSPVSSPASTRRAARAAGGRSGAGAHEAAGPAARPLAATDQDLLATWPMEAQAAIAALWQNLPPIPPPGWRRCSKSPVVRRIGHDPELGQPPAGGRTDTAPRLYLRRYWQYERSVATAVAALRRAQPVDEARARTWLDRLFPGRARHSGPRGGGRLAEARLRDRLAQAPQHPSPAAPVPARDLHRRAPAFAR